MFALRWRAAFLFALVVLFGSGARPSAPMAWLPPLAASQAEKSVSNALDPAFADAHLRLANLYCQRGQYAGAVPEYLQALRLSPNVPDAHFRLGQAYVHLGKKELADKEFQLHKQL